MSHGGDDGEIPEEHEEHVNHEAWVIPYADLLTLLMAMFIALFAVSNVDSAKFKALARGFSDALGGGKLDPGIGGSGKTVAGDATPMNGPGLLGGSGNQLLAQNSGVSQSQLQAILSQLSGSAQAKQQAQQTLADVQEQINKAANNLGLSSEVKTKQLNNGLEVTLLTDQVLFESGQANIRAGGDQLLDVIGGVLSTVDNPILINGYTDNQPINTAQFKSNLYLSSARADAVAEYFIAHGFDPNRLSPAGRGALDPIASNATVEGRAQNRRVEIIVQSKLVKKALDQAGLNSDAAPPTTLPISQPTSHVSGARPNLLPGLGAG